jgi:hypothetical protein
MNGEKRKAAEGCSYIPPGFILFLVVLRMVSVIPTIFCQMAE